MPKLVELTRHGDVCVARLRREEKLNALSAEVEGALADALRYTRVTDSRCVVFTGSERAFSAGADVDEFADLDPAAIAAITARPARSTSALQSCRSRPSPRSRATAWGWPRAGACLRPPVADSTATFGFPEVALGILPSSGGTLRVVRLAGPARAKELVMLGEHFGAAEAHALGLATEAVAEGEALPRALELGARLAELPPLALTTAKQAIDAVPDASREAGLLLERLAYALLAQTADAQEAVERFEKRSSS